MGFMDSVTNFTKGVGTKAKGNYDVVSLNAQISTIQREITGLFTSIGERYYETHKDSPEECFSGMIKEVDDRIRKINSIQQEIESTKEAMAAVSFVTPQQAVRYCVKCGTPLDIGNVFCVKCGAKQPAINEGATGVSETVTEVTETVAEVNETVSEVSSADEKRICPECGALLKDDAAFCTKCGAKIG